MSTKRQPSKQRRQTQNARQRAAINARRQAAAEGTAPAGKVGSTSRPTPAAGGSMLSRLRGATSTGRAARTGGTARTGTLPVGHRAALSALLAAIAGAVIGAVLFKVPVDRSGEAIVTREALVAEWVVSAHAVVVEDPEVSAEEIPAAVDDWLPGGSEPYVQAFWPISAAVVLPVLGTGLGFRAVSRRSPAKLVNRTMYVTLFGSLLSSQLLLIFLPAVIGLAIAAFQVRKAEVAAGTAAALDADDDVIDVDEVDDGDDVIQVDEVDEVDEDVDVAVDAVEDELLVEDEVLIEAEESAGDAADDQRSV